ncbi:hypothetical protein NIES2100_65210 [Calothrix sp. NIES-2100]|uniref:hypothetical protein n=1 Tax=Calothrix sp. NIES-2100 TaxID=1954172 RepID=UPI000B5E1248|nr:hypothetical protein NIES2100_65210 [Calothrix sp. NIES-2100]
MAWNWFMITMNAVLDTAFRFAPQMYIAEQQTKNTRAIIESNSALAEKREEIQLEYLKLQYLQDKERQNFQANQNKLSYERNKELQTFIQYCENIRLQQNFEFQRWRFQKEKELQLLILKLNQDFQRELALIHRETSLKSLEEQKRLENSPIWLIASDILNSNVGEITPMHIFLSPAKIQYERFTNAANTSKGFPDIELTLAEGLRYFFKNYCSYNRPLDFVGGAWVSASYHSEASIKALRGVLKTEPTLILETEVDGDYLNFRIAYWSYNVANFRYDSVISRLSYRDILYESAKERARQWQITRKKLIATGENPEEVDKLYGGDNLQNWAILQREESARKAGVDKNEVEYHYMVNKKDVEELSNFITIYHCIFAGLIADEYFLIEYNFNPVLPQLLPNLITQIPERDAIQALINKIVNYYQDITSFFVENRSALAPEFLIDLALNLGKFTNHNWVVNQLIYSLETWLKIRKLSVANELEVLLNKVEANLTDRDRDYVNKLNRLLSVIGHKRSLRIVNNFYEPEFNDTEEFEIELDKNLDIDFDNQQDASVDYYNLVAFVPNSNLYTSVQWLHHSCEFPLQIGDNGKIRCEYCSQNKLIFDWYITDNNHLSERPFGTKIDVSSALSFAGQMIPIAGQKWMNRFLENLE